MSGKDVRVGRYRRRSKASCEPRDPDRCPICGKPNATHPKKAVEFQGQKLVMNVCSTEPPLWVRRTPYRPPMSPRYVKLYADEAQDIIDHQGYVVGYDTEALARAIRSELNKRGTRTEVYADVGPPVAEPRTRFEARELEKLGARPHHRYIRWGLRKIKYS